MNALAHLPPPPVLAAVSRLFLSLYLAVRRDIAPQLEAFVGGVLLRVAAGRAASSAGPPPPPALVSVALESLVDMARLPTFLPDLFVNFDCALDAGDVYEELVNGLCKVT